MPKPKIVNCRECDVNPAGAVRVRVAGARKLRVRCPQCLKVGPAHTSYVDAVIGWNDEQTGGTTLDDAAAQTVCDLAERTAAENLKPDTSEMATGDGAAAKSNADDEPFDALFDPSAEELDHLPDTNFVTPEPTGPALKRRGAYKKKKTK